MVNFGVPSTPYLPQPGADIDCGASTVYGLAATAFRAVRLTIIGFGLPQPGDRTALPGFAAGDAMVQRTGQARICRGCWQQMRLPIPLRGPLSLPFRIVGIRPSQMNPNLCTICELMFERVMKRRSIEIDATILFADIRGYTTLAQAMAPTELSRLLNFFYDECAGAIWREDGLLNKVIGDAVLAIFNFPIRHADHARKALAVARDIQARCTETCRREFAGYGLDTSELGVGIGIGSGLTTFGEFGHAHTDFTAVGSVVNLAARLQSAAAPGQILMSAEAWRAVDAEDNAVQQREVVLKGYDAPQVVYAC